MDEEHCEEWMYMARLTASTNSDDAFATCDCTEQISAHRALYTNEEINSMSFWLDNTKK